MLRSKFTKLPISALCSKSNVIQRAGFAGRRSVGIDDKDFNPLSRITTLLDGDDGRSTEKNKRDIKVRGKLAIDRKDIGKLMKGLESSPKSEVLDVSSEGFHDAMAEDIITCLNETLRSTSMMRSFGKRVSDTTEVIEIVEAKINRDYSHVTAYWESDVIKKFVDMVNEEKGKEMAHKLSKTMEKNVTTKLQKVLFIVCIHSFIILCFYLLQSFPR